MNNFLIVVFIFIVFGSCTSRSDRNNLNVNFTDDKRGKFVVDPEIHNFGELESGEVITFSFKISNIGDGDLQIDSIDSGCGCIEIECNQNYFKKNESGYVTVVFNSAGEWGNIYKPIVFYTNTKETRKIIYISAKVNNQLFN